MGLTTWVSGLKKNSGTGGQARALADGRGFGAVTARAVVPLTCGPMRRGAHVSVAVTARAVTAPDPCPKRQISTLHLRAKAKLDESALWVLAYDCRLPLLPSTHFPCG